jgi:MerR family copper efflux transcriptional regulator
MKIGELSEQSGLSCDSIRFYERRGLLSLPSRTPSGYREYSSEAVQRLTFVRKARELGFTLKEVAQLMTLALDQGAGAKDVHTQALLKMSELDRRISALQEIRENLRRLVEACGGEGIRSQCPILEALL